MNTVIIRRDGIFGTQPQYLSSSPYETTIKFYTWSTNRKDAAILYTNKDGLAVLKLLKQKQNKKKNKKNGFSFLIEQTDFYLVKFINSKLPLYFAGYVTPHPGITDPKDRILTNDDPAKAVGFDIRSNAAEEAKYLNKRIDGLNAVVAEHPDFINVIW